ncbi:MAG: GH92 family glycosyl hydrolase [Acidobacteriota bacterium]
MRQAFGNKTSEVTMKAIALLTLAGVLGIGVAAGAAQSSKQPVDYVDPNIGGIGQLLTATVPYVQYPYGMARVAPVTTPGITDRYLADKIEGFPAGPALLMASTGPEGTRPEDYASEFDHDFETATPYYYEADLQTWNIKAEATTTRDAACYRLTYPATPHAHLVLVLHNHAQFTVIGPTAVEGSEQVGGNVAKLADAQGETREYFYIEFSRPQASWKTWQNGSLGTAAQISGDDIGYVTDTATANGETIEARVGISYISTDQARRNLEREIPTWGFDAVRQQSRAVWNRALGAIATVGGTERQRTIFYTALYRSLGRMTDITEDGRYFSGFDHQVHSSEGHDFYVDDGLWDTFRSLHPLQTLLDARRQEDMARSYIRMDRQSGWMPSFPSVAGEQAVMIGHHAAEFILDLYEKGYRDFDVEQAYEGIRKNATQATLLPWRRAPLTPLDKVYFEKGFFPALAFGDKETIPEVTGERRQAVSVTIENSYDDWCVAQLARALGKMKDAAYFTRLAQNYRNVFNPAIGFMAPKSADGKWVEPFDPKLGGGQGGRDYFTEMDAWVYTFAVQHDVAGLIRLFGSRDAFNRRLDRLFVEQYGTSKYRFLNQFPDATGLVGLYAQGNEPSFHIPYLYDFSGQPWKTQRRVRQLIDLWYGDGPLGIPGDDDGGETSSWYVFSAMGFYPVCPGSPVYEIGSPIFAKTTIRMGNDKEFTIVADHVSAQNKYIQSAQLNGRPLDKPWFSHSDIANGGTLTLEMGPQPNPRWGSAPEDAPPSMSTEKSTSGYLAD